jgi:hypothetical protein
MRLKLVLSILFFCGFINAQTNTELKDFINKNNTAIRTVQKNMLKDNNTAYSNSFKEILKNQEAAVKQFSSNKLSSGHFALLVRTECLNFLKKYTKGSTDYFEITESEKNIVKSGDEINSKILTVSEIKSIDDLDAINPQSLNALTLTIQ